jgi:hypothetical protein
VALLRYSPAMHTRLFSLVALLPVVVSCLPSNPPDDDTCVDDIQSQSALGLTTQKLAIVAPKLHLVLDDGADLTCDEDGGCTEAEGCVLSLGEVEVGTTSTTRIGLLNPTSVSATLAGVRVVPQVAAVALTVLVDGVAFVAADITRDNPISVPPRDDGEVTPPVSIDIVFSPTEAGDTTTTLELLADGANFEGAADGEVGTMELGLTGTGVEVVAEE